MVRRSPTSAPVPARLDPDCPALLAQGTALVDTVAVALGVIDGVALGETDGGALGDSVAAGTTVLLSAASAVAVQPCPSVNCGPYVVNSLAPA